MRRTDQHSTAWNIKRAAKELSELGVGIQLAALVISKEFFIARSEDWDTEITRFEFSDGSILRLCGTEDCAEVEE